MNIIPFLFRWAVLVIAVFISANLGFLGISYDSIESVLTAALVLGVINTFVKPVLMLISMPFIVLSLGFMVLLINAFLFKLASALVSGFHVTSFWSALGGAMVVSFISFILGANRKPVVVQRTMHATGPSRTQNKRPPSGNPPPGKGPIIDV